VTGEGARMRDDGQWEVFSMADLRPDVHSCSSSDEREGTVTTPNLRAFDADIDGIIELVQGARA